MASPSLLKTKQITTTSIACAIAACAPISLTSLQAQESTLQQEINRRTNDTHAAQELLIVGDSAYKKQDYEIAVKSYAEAFRLMPSGSLNAQLRAATADRYATAATERSRRLARFGNYEEARQLLSNVLSPNVAPHHLGAQKLSKQLDDPIRYNPALTREHVDNVVEVGHLLRKAEGYYNLAQFDEAEASYQSVLRVDAYNSAARRGLEKTNAAQSRYYNSARDQTRSEMLNEVSQSWESPVPALNPTSPVALGSSLGNAAQPIQQRLKETNIQSIDLDQAQLDEALDFIRIQSRQGSAGETLPPLNIILKLGDMPAAEAEAIKNARVSINATNLPLSILLNYITEQTGTKWSNDGSSIIVSPINSNSGAIITKSFRVPPTIFSTTNQSSQDSEENIFGDNNDNAAGKLAKKISAQEYLLNNGVTFPEGASASYTASINSLVVKNTVENIERVEQIVTVAANVEPVQIVTKVTIIRVSETKLKELGFDWLITPFELGSSLLTGGSNGTSTTELISDTLQAAAPVTAGLRSGSVNALSNSIDTFLNSPNSGFGDTPTRAPGILTLTHTIGPAQLQLIMRGLNQNRGSDVVVQPSVISRPGELANLVNVQEIIHPTEYEPPEVASSGQNNNNNNNNNNVTGVQLASTPATTPSHPTAFETTQTGVNISVEANVDESKNFIHLSLNPSLVDFEGFVNYGSAINTPVVGASPLLINGTGTLPITDNDILMPIFRKITTNQISTTVQDGATVVLATLVSKRSTRTVDSVPILGNLPIAGRLFRNESESSFSEAVIIMVNSEIVDPTGAPWRSR